MVAFDKDGEEWLLNYCKKKGNDSSKSLVVKKQIQNYWNEAEVIISEANQYGGTVNERMMHIVLCQNKDEKLYLAEALSKGGDYYAGVAAKMFLDYGEEAEFLKVRQENLHYGSDYIELANYYVKKRQYDKAMGLIEDICEVRETQCIYGEVQEC